MIRGKRFYAVVALFVTAGVSLGMKFFPENSWFRNYGAGIGYEIFWIFLLYFLVPGKLQKPKIIAALVFALTSVVEFSQLWHPAWLESARNNFFGKALLGTDFDWMDFPYYAMGCFMGWIGIQYFLTGGKS